LAHDAVSVTAILVLAAFALDRITKGVFFLLSFVPPWKARFPEPSMVSGAQAKYEAARSRRLLYFVFCGLLACVVVGLSSDFRVLSAMDISGPSWLDVFLTWLVLVAGSDRIKGLTPDRHGPERIPPKSRRSSSLVASPVEKFSESLRSRLPRPLAVFTFAFAVTHIAALPHPR
jgi:hypothetical protein